jgi:hypothetical protein
MSIPYPSADSTLIAGIGRILADAIRIAVQDQQTLAALRAVMSTPDAATDACDTATLARALRVSKAQVSRLTKSGLPYQIVGTRKRYNLVECRAWLAARGPVAAPRRTNKRRDDSGIDLSDVRGIKRSGSR